MYTRSATLALLTAFLLSAQDSVVTNRYNNQGTGANLKECVLDAANVNPSQFGKLFSFTVSGSVYAQPLYLSSVQIPGQGTHNIIYVATMDDQVYAFDADHPCDPYWQRDLANRAAGSTPVPIADITGNNNLNIVGDVGILSTPVIDPASGIMYLVARTKQQGTYSQRLYALDVRTGKERLPPALIRAHIKSTAKDAVGGYLDFDAKAQAQRPALSLTNGQIVIAWGSHEDIDPYHGWIMAYDARTLRQTAVRCITPTGERGGIWQSGRGPVVDAAGNIYYETGNGKWNGTTDFGESLLKLQIRNGKFVVADYFTPSNYASLNRRDADFGSSGPMLIPGTNLILTGDKHGVLSLFNTNNLGKLSLEEHGGVQSIPNNGGRVMSGPAWWQGPDGATLYLWTEADVLKAFRFSEGVLEPKPFAKGKSKSHGSPGGALTVSADGAKGGTGIVWALLTIHKSIDHGSGAGVLRAFNAETLEEIWNSEENPERDALGTLVKFVPPTVVAGKVYAPTYDNLVNVYGLLDTKLATKLDTK